MDNTGAEEEVESLVQVGHDLAGELLTIIENVSVKGDPSWVGWTAAVDMKGRILAAFERACREKGLDVSRR